MVTLLFWILLFIVFGKLLIFAVRASWRISKIIFTLILLPLVLIGLVLNGFLILAAPILVIIGIISLMFLHD